MRIALASPKGTFNTHPSLKVSTMCGAVALKSAKPRENAAAIDLIKTQMICSLNFLIELAHAGQLLNARLIILPKVNLSVYF